VRVRSRQRQGIDGQPCRMHAWACPVIMKTDPEHAAWTCARCGSLAVTPVGERPQPSGRAEAVPRARTASSKAA